METIIITAKEAGQRGDKFLLKYFNKAPKSLIYRYLRKKNIKLNKGKMAGSEILAEGDEIQVYLSAEKIDSLKEEKRILKTRLQFQVVFEDENILVVNKPAGVICHGDKTHVQDTLNDQILYYLRDNSSYTKPAICNRLDVNTTGIVIAGKHLQALQNINQAFQNHEMKKEYIAIVCGTIKKGGVISEGLLKDKRNNRVAPASENGKKAITYYEPLAYHDGFTLVKIDLETGRSHQIRAHFQNIGHPVLGDPKYGLQDINKKYRIKRQLLHAYRLTWHSINYYPYLQGKTFEAKFPEDYKIIGEKWFGNMAVILSKGRTH